MRPTTSAGRCALVLSLLAAASAERAFKLCLVIPYDDSYKHVELGALQAVEDINNRSTKLVRRTGEAIAASIADLTVSIEVVEQDTGKGQDSVLDTYDRAENCTNNGAHAIIGPAYSSRAKVLSQYLARRRHLPLVSFSATSPALSDSSKYPYFTRTVTADDAVAFAAIDFVVQMGWERVAFLYGEDIFGSGLHTACRNYKDMHASGLGWLSVPFPADVTEESKIEAALETIQRENFLVVFYAGVSTALPFIIRKAVELNIIGKNSGYTWVGFDSWSSHGVDSTPHLRDAMGGSIRLQASGCPGGPTNNALVEKLRSVDPMALSKKYGGSPMPASFAEMGAVDCFLGFSYDGVWLAALAFASLFGNSSAVATAENDGSHAASARCEASMNDVLRGQSYYEALLNTEFDGGSASVRLTPSGNRDPSSIRVSIENLLVGGNVTYVGELSQEELTTSPIDTSLIIWADGTSDIPRSFIPAVPSTDGSKVDLRILLPVLVLTLGVGLLAIRERLRASRLARRRQQSTLRFAESGTVVCLPPLTNGRSFHLFLSHAQDLGQDQVRTIKLELVRLLPTVKIFLDVEALDDTHKLGELVARSQKLLLFLTTGCLRRFFVRQEVLAAVQHGTGIIAVQETDERHGYSPMASHYKDCPAGALAAVFGKGTGERGIPGKGDSFQGEQRHSHGSGGGKGEILWFRAAHYMTVSLKQIVQRMVADDTESGGALPELSLPGEISHQHVPLPVLAHGKVHLWLPDCAPFCNRLEACLKDALEGLSMRRATPGQLGKALAGGSGGGNTDGEKGGQSLAQVLLVPLSKDTLLDEGVRKDLSSAIARGMQVLLLHIQEVEFGAVPFSTFFEQCPSHLQDAGLFDNIAAIWFFEGPAHLVSCKCVGLKLQDQSLPVQQKLVARMWAKGSPLLLFRSRRKGSKPIAPAPAAKHAVVGTKDLEEALDLEEGR